MPFQVQTLDHIILDFDAALINLIYLEGGYLQPFSSGGTSNVGEHRLQSS
jgi:hypothetical protein